MAWTEKQQQTTFERLELPIHGIHFLDGDLLALLFRREWTKGMKFPLITFPSGVELELWEAAPEAEATVHFFGEMDLSYRATRDKAFTAAQAIAAVCGYVVRTRGKAQLDVWSSEPAERFTLTYDNADHRLVDVAPLREAVELPIHPAHVLMNDEIRAQLPPLYANEQIGLDAVAPVKYFTPDANWTWYASEFDGKDLFFGLVDGFETELGYFRLSELQSVRGALGLLIERDLHYQPQTLRALLEAHQQQ